MKTLILATQAQLQADLSYVRDRDVFITEDEDLIPAQVKFPAVGIKDGSEKYDIETGNQESGELYLDIIAYVRLSKPGAAIMGDASTGKKGVLDIVKDIKASLSGQHLGGIVETAVPVESGGSEAMGDEEEAIQKKRITMKYERFD